jgi:hypothetical protein
MQTRRKPEELSEEERQQLHQAHQRLRNASSALEALTVVKPVRGRWTANPAPAEVLTAAQTELHTAWEELRRVQSDLLSWDPPPSQGADQQ